MSIQPAYIDIETPIIGHPLEIHIGFSWGGDATKEVARADSRAFKDAVVTVVKSVLDISPLLVGEMAKESCPLNGKYRYLGGRTSEKVQAILDAAVETVAQRSPVSRSCVAILMKR